MANDLVVVDNVTKTFLHEGNSVTVLRGVSLRVAEGEMLCIVGQSGAGKSTLLHLIGTLDLPTTGRILYDGKDVTKLSSARLSEFRNTSIGFVFQFHHLLPEFTALENVMMPGLIHGRPKKPLEQRARELLGEVGLGHRVTHRPGELSGGEQQRVALARALVMDPRVVLADEPTGNLDSHTSDAIHRLLFDLNERLGTTFVIVTHSRDLAERMPRTVHMKDGQVERDETRAREPRGAAAEVPAIEPESGAPGDDRGTAASDPSGGAA